MNKPEIYNKNLAEFTGIILGDGSIGEYECDKGDGSTNIQRKVAITISSEEKDFAEHIENLFKKLFDISPNRRTKTNEKVIELRSFRNDLFNYLTKK